MGLFDAFRARSAARAVARYERTSYTPGQVGDAAVPELHEANATPASVEVYGDELPDIVSYAPREARSWRGKDTLGQPQGTPFTSTGGGGVLANDHLTQGVPDPRAVWGSQIPAGTSFGPIGPDAELYRVQTETVSNFRIPVVETPQMAPTVTRAGSTGEDAARTATLPGWTFLRAFDKNMADELAPPGLDKVNFRSPLASRPIDYTGIVPGALPSPGGDQPTEGVGRASSQPNSVRLIPRSWDELLVNNGPSQAEAVQVSPGTRRAAGWRAS